MSMRLVAMTTLICRGKRVNPHRRGAHRDLTSDRGHRQGDRGSYCTTTGE